MNANAREWNVSAPHPERVAQIRVYWRELAVTRYRKSKLQGGHAGLRVGRDRRKKWSFLTHKFFAKTLDDPNRPCEKNLSSRILADTIRPILLYNQQHKYEHQTNTIAVGSGVARLRHVGKCRYFLWGELPGERCSYHALP